MARQFLFFLMMITIQRNYFPLFINKYNNFFFILSSCTYFTTKFINRKDEWNGKNSPFPYLWCVHFFLSLKLILFFGIGNQVHFSLKIPNVPYFLLLVRCFKYDDFCLYSDCQIIPFKLVCRNFFLHQLAISWPNKHNFSLFLIFNNKTTLVYFWFLKKNSLLWTEQNRQNLEWPMMLLALQYSVAMVNHHHHH